MSLRETVDLSLFPDLVVVYLGMRANSLRGLRTVIAFGPRIQRAVNARPEGLLLHEQLLFGLFPLHLGMRQYWSDLASLETWTRQSPHLDWWKSLHRDPAGVTVWHEAYFLRGGIDSVYIAADAPIGLQRFAPRIGAHGAMSTGRMRAQAGNESKAEAPDDLYPQR